MKTFNQFKQDMNEGKVNLLKGAIKFLAKGVKKYPVAGAVGMGAGTGINYLLIKNSLKKRKLKLDKDSEKFLKTGEFQESVAVAAVKGGSKLVPALMTGIGAAGLIMQSKKSKGPFADTGGFDASKSRTKRQYLGLPPSSNLSKKEKKNRKLKGQKEIIDRRDDKIAKEGPGDLVPGAKRARLNSLLKKYLERSGIQSKRDANNKIDRDLGKK